MNRYVRIGVMIVTDPLPQDKRGEVRQIAARHGARDIRVFGSVARGDARSDSDIDFLVEMEPGRSLLGRIELIYDLRECLGREADVVTDNSVHWFIRGRVQRVGSAMKDPIDELGSRQPLEK